MVRKRILLVDDLPPIPDRLNRLLLEAGFNVVSIRDEEEGIKASMDNPFDLIIADLHMPRLNVLKILDDIHKIQMNANTPTFVLTTEPLGNFSHRYRVLQASTWLVKPYDPDLLLRCIELIVTRDATGTSSALSAER